jgi:hypothetical protein
LHKGESIVAEAKASYCVPLSGPTDKARFALFGIWQAPGFTLASGTRIVTVISRLWPTGMSTKGCGCEH